MRFCNNSEGGVGSSTTGFFDLRRKDMAKMDGQIKPIISFTSRQTDNVTTAPGCTVVPDLGLHPLCSTRPPAGEAGIAQHISLQTSRARALRIIVGCGGLAKKYWTRCARLALHSQFSSLRSIVGLCSRLRIPRQRVRQGRLQSCMVRHLATRLKRAWERGVNYLSWPPCLTMGR